MSQDVKNLVFDQLQSRFQRLLPYKDHVRVLIHQYEPLAHKFNRVSVKEVLKNIRLRYTQAEWYELKYLFRATFVFILRSVSPTLQISSTDELVKKYPDLANEKMSTLIFLLEFWNLLTITLLIFDPNENGKDMMFSLERMCSPFQSSWNTTIHQRVLLFEGETKVSLSAQCSNEESRRPAIPHNNSTFNAAEVYLQMQRQQQLVQEVQNRAQQLQRFEKLYPQPSSHQQQQEQYPPHFQSHIQHHTQNHNAQHGHQFQPSRPPFQVSNPQLISTVQQQRQQLELQLFQRRQQSLQQLYFPPQPQHAKSEAKNHVHRTSYTSSDTNNQGNYSSHMHDSNTNTSTGASSSSNPNFGGYGSNNSSSSHRHTTYADCSNSTFNNNHHHINVSGSINNQNASGNTRKRSLSDPPQPDTQHSLVQAAQSRADFWQQRITLMCHNVDIPCRISMLPPAHPVYQFPAHDISVTPIRTLLPCTNNTTLRDVVKDVLREYYVKKQKRFDVDVHNKTHVA